MVHQYYIGKCMALCFFIFAIQNIYINSNPALADVHLNWLNWFHFLILKGGLLVILIVIYCMIFLSPFLDVARCLSVCVMSTVSFLAELDFKTINYLHMKGVLDSIELWMLRTADHFILYTFILNFYCKKASSLYCVF